MTKIYSIPMKEYKHFLRYNQLCELDLDYGFTDLSYKIGASYLFIKQIDNVVGSENEFDFPIQDNKASIESIIEGFMISFMSNTKNFVGKPEFISSDMFSEEAFNNMLKRSIEIIDKRQNTIVQLNSGNELINFCKSNGLNPEPQGEDPYCWYANCPSGGKHHIMISTKSNEWGCGYCQKKGDLKSLVTWYENLKNKAE